MPDCPYCGKPTQRGSRGLLRKLVSSAVFYCKSCGRSVSIPRHYLSVFRRYAECPKCGTRKLSRIFSRDRVDTISANPLRRLLGLVGAPLYHCIFCRFQFRDWRKRESDERVNPTYRV